MSNTKTDRGVKYLDEQMYACGKDRWRVSRLIKLSEKLKVFRIPLKHLNIYNLFPKAQTTLSFVNHVKLVNTADLSAPIILDEEGYVMDGRHRVIKALLNKESSILAVRFDKTPPRCYEGEDTQE